MAQIQLSNEQLHLIQIALDLYSRFGALQFSHILNHPSIEKEIIKQCTDPAPLEVGDISIRGEVVEIGRDYITTKGSWGNGEETRTWNDPDNVLRSPDWKEVHRIRDDIRLLGAQMAYRISGDPIYLNTNVNRGIFNDVIDESCREAFDLLQVIRHEFWKENPNRSQMTVDSSIHFTSNRDMVNVKVELDKKK